MLNINGKEYGLFWSVWANCEYEDWLLSREKVSYPRAFVQKAVIMNKAYRDANGGGNELKTKDLLSLPASELNAIMDAVTAQELLDSGRTVEAEADDQENAESPEE